MEDRGIEKTAQEKTAVSVWLIVILTGGAVILGGSEKKKI